MNAYKYISLILTVSIGLFISAQNQTYNKYCLYSDYSVSAYKKGDLLNSIALMDSAIKNCPEQANTFENWFNLALFNKQKAKETNDIKDREAALNAILKAKTLDNKEEYLDNSNAIIKSLANLYMNDASILITDTSSNFKTVESTYKKYKSIYQIALPSKSFKEEDINFYSVLAQVNYSKYENNKVLYKNHLDSTIKNYNKVLSIDSSLADIYKGLGSLYFNQAIDIIYNLDEEDWEAAIIADGKKADLALKSIPYFKKAYELSPNDSKMIYSLAGCYELLSQKKEFEFYLNLLKEKDPKYYNEVYTFPSN